jgi:catechol 2,3-dioxygenase-like lactoylglutathione lyase family enzyme
MKIVPVFKCRNMKQALDFYTGVLDFKLRDEQESEEDTVINLSNQGADLQLTTHESEQLFGSVANIWVNDVDSLFALYRTRGLDTSAKPNSPVHQGPVDQTWGTREFYVTDTDGNTLRFCMTKD